MQRKRPDITLCYFIIENDNQTLLSSLRLSAENLPSITATGKVIKSNFGFSTTMSVSVP